MSGPAFFDGKDGGSMHNASLQGCNAHIRACAKTPDPAMLVTRGHSCHYSNILPPLSIFPIVLPFFLPSLIKAKESNSVKGVLTNSESDKN